MPHSSPSILISRGPITTHHASRPCLRDITRQISTHVRLRSPHLPPRQSATPVLPSLPLTTIVARVPRLQTSLPVRPWLGSVVLCPPSSFPPFFLKRLHPLPLSPLTTLSRTSYPPPAKPMYRKTRRTGFPSIPATQAPPPLALSSHPSVPLLPRATLHRPTC